MARTRRLRQAAAALAVLTLGLLGLPGRPGLAPLAPPLTPVGADPGTITASGTPTPVSSSSGAKAVLTFSGVAGQRVSLVAFASTFHGASDVVSILGPGNAPVGGSAALNQISAYLAPRTLPTTGTYQVVVDPSTTGDPGSTTLYLYTVVDQTGPLTPDAPATNFDVTAPGQRIVRTFTGTAGELVNLIVGTNDSSTHIETVDLVAPSSAVLASLQIVYATNINGFGGPVGSGIVVLPADGTYSVILDSTPDGITSSVPVRLITYPATTVVANGPPVPATDAAGQASLVRFAARAGQTAFFSITASTFTHTADNAAVIDPSFHEIGSHIPLTSPSALAPPATIPSDGLYSVAVRSGPLDTGSASVSVTLLAAPTIPSAPSLALVKAAYADFLDRPPTPTELSAAGAGLDGATLTRAALVRSLATSPEWIDAIVDQLYQDTLGRAGDAAGVAFWAGRIASGSQTVAQVAAAFYASAEYYGGIGGGTPQSWITDLYQKLLDRVPDSNGLTYWTGQVAHNGRTRVASAFFQSPESARVRVGGLYQKLLGRAPDAGGLAYWAGQVVVHGDLALAESLAASPEYASRSGLRFP